MIAGQTCSTCAAHSALTNECRANAPTPVMLPGPEGQLRTLGIFPAIRADGWCGQWRAHPENNQPARA